MDSGCLNPFPLDIPPAQDIAIHRVVVACGATSACSRFYGGGASGSLIIDTHVCGDDHAAHPFTIGNVDASRGFIHVFDDFSLDVVFSEIDTVSDFLSYLRRREAFLTQSPFAILATGEEQLLALYLTKIDQAGQHDFVLPADAPAKPDGIVLDESHWRAMRQNPQYLAKKKADRVSFLWDKLIEYFVLHARAGNNIAAGAARSVEGIEWGLRRMASEHRLRRRQLGNALDDFLRNAEPGRPRTRMVYSNDHPENVYLFLIAPQGEVSDDEYRDGRRAFLEAYCRVAKVRRPTAKYVIGFALGSRNDKRGSEDLIVLDARKWSAEEQADAEALQGEAQLLLDENVVLQETYDREYPVAERKDARPGASNSSSRNRERKKRKAQRKSRKRNRNR